MKKNKIKRQKINFEKKKKKMRSRGFSFVVAEAGDVESGTGVGKLQEAGHVEEDVGNDHCVLAQCKQCVYWRVV